MGVGVRRNGAGECSLTINDFSPSRTAVREIIIVVVVVAVVVVVTAVAKATVVVVPVAVESN